MYIVLKYSLFGCGFGLGDDLFGGFTNDFLGLGNLFHKLGSLFVLRARDCDSYLQKERGGSFSIKEEGHIGVFLKGTGSTSRVDRSLNCVTDCCSLFGATGDKDNLTSFQNSSYSHCDRETWHFLCRFEKSRIVFNSLRSKISQVSDTV
jgi:hypothetical protein